MKTWRVSAGNQADVIKSLTHPERCGIQSGRGVFDDGTIKEWPSREGLKQTIKMQEKRAPESRDWRMLVRDCPCCLSNPHADFCPQKGTKI